MNRAAIVFDMDGTLLDSLKDIVKNYNSTLSFYGFSTCSNTKYSEVLGYGPYETFKKVIPEKFRDDDKFLNEMSNHYKTTSYENALHNSKLYDGIMEMLKELQKTCDLAVFSNKPQALLEYIVSNYFDGINFCYLQGSDNYNPCKPEKESVDMLIKKSGFLRSNILFVGDSIIDAKSAKVGNLQGVGVSWGMDSEKELISFGMGCVVNTIDELKEKVYEFSSNISSQQ